MSLFKLQFSGLSWRFWLTMCVVCLILTISNFYTNETILHLVVSLSGAIYAFFAGKGKVICFGFGFVYNFAYAYVCYENKLYAETILNLCFYFPIGIWGVYHWLIHQNTKKAKINVRFLTNFQRGFYALLILVAMPICFAFFDYIGTKYTYAESFIFVSFIVAFVLQVRRYVENYFIVTLANLVSIGVWFFLSESLSILLTTCIFLWIGICYFVEWFAEAKEGECKQ